MLKIIVYNCYYFVIFIQSTVAQLATWKYCTSRRTPRCEFEPCIIHIFFIHILLPFSFVTFSVLELTSGVFLKRFFFFIYFFFFFFFIFNHYISLFIHSFIHYYFISEQYM